MKMTRSKLIDNHNSYTRSFKENLKTHNILPIERRPDARIRQIARLAIHSQAIAKTPHTSLHLVARTESARSALRHRWPARLTVITIASPRIPTETRQTGLAVSTHRVILAVDTHTVRVAGACVVEAVAPRQLAIVVNDAEDSVGYSEDTAFTVEGLAGISTSV